MKTFTDRYEIAKLLNFGKYPVLALDLAKDKLADFEGCYYGQKVGWWEENRRTGDKYLWHGNLGYWGDTKQLSISSDNACLKASFGYQDVAEDLANAQAPVIKENSPVVIIIHDSKKRVACVCLADIGKINNHCQTATTIEGDWQQVIKKIEETQNDE